MDNWFRKVRKRSGLKQHEVAARAHVSKSTIARWEQAKGKTTAHRGNISAVAAVLQINESDLVAALNGSYPSLPDSLSGECIRVDKPTMDILRQIAREVGQAIPEWLSRFTNWWSVQPELVKVIIVRQVAESHAVREPSTELPPEHQKEPLRRRAREQRNQRNNPA